MVCKKETQDKCLISWFNHMNRNRESESIKFKRYPTLPWTHTRSSGQPFMLRRLGSSWGFGALLKGTSVVVLRVERALYIHCPHLQFLPARDLNPQPLDYETESLTVRPQLPHDLPLWSPFPVCIWPVYTRLCSHSCKHLLWPDRAVWVLQWTNGLSLL